MTMIYTPSGKAREYSPLALNLYLKCSHHCRYCYAPSAMQRTRDTYFCKPEPRKNVIENIVKELKRNRPTEQVLLSFIGDVYCETQDNNFLTREVLEILLENKVPVAILTKGGKRCLKDIDIFKRFGEHIQVGSTLTFDNDKDSYEWESGAAAPQERLEVLKTLHEEGIKTFASFEPVIVPEQSIKMIRKSLEFIDVYKIGKINNFQGIDKAIDWASFLQECLDVLRPAGKQFYIKHDLRLAAPIIRLYGNEVLPDEHNIH